MVAATGSNRAGRAGPVVASAGASISSGSRVAASAAASTASSSASASMPSSAVAVISRAPSTDTNGISKPMISRVPGGRLARRVATSSAVSRTTSRPHCRQIVRPTRA